MLKTYPDMCSNHHLRDSFVHFLLSNAGVHCRTQLGFGVLIKNLAQNHKQMMRMSNLCRLRMRIQVLNSLMAYGDFWWHASLLELLEKQMCSYLWKISASFYENTSHVVLGSFYESISMSLAISANTINKQGQSHGYYRLEYQHIFLEVRISLQ